MTASVKLAKTHPAPKNVVAGKILPYVNSTHYLSLIEFEYGVFFIFISIYLYFSFCQ